MGGASGDLLTFVLGGGLVATVGAVVSGLKMWREGTSARQSKAIAGLERWRLDADRRASKESARADWYQQVAGAWQGHAGTLTYELTRNGVPVPPMPPLPERPQEACSDGRHARDDDTEPG